MVGLEQRSLSWVIAHGTRRRRRVAQRVVELVLLRAAHLVLLRSGCDIAVEVRVVGLREVLVEEIFLGRQWLKDCL